MSGELESFACQRKSLPLLCQSRGQEEIAFFLSVFYHHSTQTLNFLYYYICTSPLLCCFPRQGMQSWSLSCKQGNISLLPLSDESVRCCGHSAAGALGSICGSTAANGQLLHLLVSKESSGMWVLFSLKEVLRPFQPRLSHGQHSEQGKCPGLSPCLQYILLCFTRLSSNSFSTVVGSLLLVNLWQSLCCQWFCESKQ